MLWLCRGTDKPKFFEHPTGEDPGRPSRAPAVFLPWKGNSGRWTSLTGGPAYATAIQGPAIIEQSHHAFVTPEYNVLVDNTEATM
jgi:hypothetical protein